MTLRLERRLTSNVKRDYAGRFALAVIVFALASNFASSARGRPKPESLWASLKAASTWTTRAARPFTFAGISVKRLHDGVFDGEVVVAFRSHDSLFGVSLLVADSLNLAERSLTADNRFNRATPTVPQGTYEWTSVDRGRAAGCNSPNVRCYESFLIARYGLTLITATNGSPRPPDAAAHERLRRIFSFAVARVRVIAARAGQRQFPP